MKYTYFKTSESILRPARFIFQSVDKAPPAPDNFKGPEKQTEAQMVAEVASQSPSSIFNDTISAGTAIKTQYTQSTTILANLISTDPLFTGKPVPPAPAPATNVANKLQ